MVKNKLSALVELKKEHEGWMGSRGAWRAYWRGTSNRITRADGTSVIHLSKSDLRDDLLTNPMENGVLAKEVK